MCGTVNEGNERENFDTNALDPDGWDYVSHFIRLGLGQDESMQRNMLLKTIDVMGK